MSPRERATRLAVEELSCRKELSQFGWHNQEGQIYVQGCQMSESGLTYYQLTLTIPSGYPDAMPPLYVTGPRILHKYSGRGTINQEGAAHRWHTLGNGQNGCVQICHCKPELWDASKTVVSVLMKGLLWLRAYDAHLASGEDIATFLLTQSGRY
jgi:ubiquitin-protein ligase